MRIYAKILHKCIYMRFCVHMLYIRTNQKQLRVECYQGLIDFLADAAQEHGLRLGNLVILPAMLVGSPCYERQKYYDALTIVRKFGRPDLFITFTCNLSRPEIKQQLQSYQDVSARPDTVSRVFQLKVEELMRRIRKHRIFGTVIAFVYVIEFQKHGLPHIHLIVWLAKPDQFYSGDQADQVKTCYQYLIISYMVID